MEKRAHEFRHSILGKARASHTGYRGVYHVEKNARYNLLREEAMQLCEVLNSSLATMLQMRNAWDIGFETCRYGWIDDNIVIPRIQQNPICAANNTGVYILISNITDKYDAYCFNASETREKVCEKVILPEDYQFHVPLDSDHSIIQDSKRPDRTDTEKGQQSGEDASEDETGDQHTEGSHHKHHPEGSSDQGAEGEVTHSPQAGDSSHVLHPGGIPGPGQEATTDTPHNGDPHGEHHPGGFVDHGSHDDSTSGPHPEDPYIVSHGDGLNDDVTDAPPPADSGQDDHPGGSSHHGSDDTTDGTHPGHSHHGHHPNKSPDEEPDYVTDEPFTDGSHYPVTTTAMDTHKSPGFYPNIDLTDDHHPGDSHYDDETTDAPQPGDSDQNHHPAVSPDQGMDEDTTGGPQPGDSDHGSHADGSRGSGDTTHTTHPGHSHHGHHPVGSIDQEPGDATDEPLPDGFHHSASTSSTDKPKRHGFHPSIDDAVTDSSNAAGHPYVNVLSVTESEDSDMSNFVDSNAGTDKYDGRPHQTKPIAWHPDGKDDSHSGNSVTYTDETPGSHEGHAAGGGDSESHVDDNSTGDSNFGANFATTEGDILYSKPTGDPEGAVARPDGAQPGEEDRPASTSNDDNRASGLSPNGDWSAEDGDSAVSGGLVTTKGPGFRRQPRIPDWVIIVVSLVCLAVVLAVCIAVNSRQACGHKKKLVINGSGGAAEGGQAGGMNGDPSKSQEMVNLVPKEPQGEAGDPQDHLVPPEDMQSQQKRDMNIGV
ncbi:hypothetical protein NDU88_007487 [Pleurodeles waltl]|uniref:CD44 antigen n=1 Tax=Pleurodeles waltl TaxID=8319 RepID=A0AAV7U1D9_PLEWA|nr:hypothetical protein NDU88_007487 [Pleurodeles waltl]